MQTPAEISQELLLDYNNVAASIGITPRLGEDGMPIPFGEKDGRHVYVVWVGRTVGIFNNWYVLNKPLHLLLTLCYQGPHPGHGVVLHGRDLQEVSEPSNRPRGLGCWPHETPRLAYSSPAPAHSNSVGTEHLSSLSLHPGRTSTARSFTCGDWAGHGSCARPACRSEHLARPGR